MISARINNRSVRTEPARYCRLCPAWPSLELHTTTGVNYLFYNTNPKCELIHNCCELEEFLIRNFDILYLEFLWVQLQLRNVYYLRNETHISQL